jgi:hypothetical protein
MSSTAKGRALFSKLQRAGLIDWSVRFDLDEAIDCLSKICRHGVTYDGIQVRWCNEEMSPATAAAVKDRESMIERRISGLVDQLPFGPWLVEFEGDPRGPVVVLKHINSEKEFVVA